jgi:DNA replication protein DnaC
VAQQATNDQTIKTSRASDANSVATNAAMVKAGVPLRLMHCELGTSPQMRIYPELVNRLIAPWNPERAADATDEEIKDWDRFWGQSWFLWGPVGRGKSGLAAGYVRQWLDPDYGEPSGVVWYAVPHLLGELRDTISRKSSWWRSARGKVTEGDIIRRCREAALLVLDDLGAEQVTGSGFVEDRLYQIIDGRHSDMSPTFFTSNLGLAGVEEVDEQGNKQYRPGLKDQIGERIVWRIAEMCGRDNVVRLLGPNLRLEADL